MPSSLASGSSVRIALKRSLQDSGTQAATTPTQSGKGTQAKSSAASREERVSRPRRRPASPTSDRSASPPRRRQRPIPEADVEEAAMEVDSMSDGEIRTSKDRIDSPPQRRSRDASADRLSKASSRGGRTSDDVASARDRAVSSPRRRERSTDIDMPTSPRSARRSHTTTPSPPRSRSADGSRHRSCQDKDSSIPRRGQRSEVVTDSPPRRHQTVSPDQPRKKTQKRRHVSPLPDSPPRHRHRSPGSTEEVLPKILELLQLIAQERSQQHSSPRSTAPRQDSPQVADRPPQHRDRTRPQSRIETDDHPSTSRTDSDTLAAGSRRRPGPLQITTSTSCHDHSDIDDDHPDSPLSGHDDVSFVDSTSFTDAPSPTDDAKFFTDFIGRLARALEIEVPEQRTPAEDKLFKKLDKKTPLPSYLPISPRLLELIQQIWISPATLQPTSRKLDNLYRVNDKDMPWIAQHPRPNSLVVENSQAKASARPRPYPSEPEGKKIDHLARKAYSSSILLLKIATYSAYMAGYCSFLWEKVAPFLEHLPEDQSRALSLILSEGDTLSTNQLAAARHATEAAAKVMMTSVAFRRHAWLRSTGLSSHAKAIIEDLPFDGESLFNKETDNNLEHSQKMKLTAKRCGLQDQASKPSRPRYASWPRTYPPGRQPSPRNRSRQGSGSQNNQQRRQNQSRDRQHYSGKKSLPQSKRRV